MDTSRQHGPYKTWGKRAFDVAASILGSLLTLPLWGAIALAIRLTMGSPILYRQLRPGRDERLFTLVKFRTMRPIDGGSAAGHESERITRLGALLRRASLDELPSLLNVLKGDMSLVGPRPLLPRYLPCYTTRERRRHTVRPGITGLAQVSGRNLVVWDDRLEADVRYVESMSFALDLRILARTLHDIVSSRGVVVDPRRHMLNLDEERNCSG